MIDNRDSKTNLRSDQTNDHGLADIKFLKVIFSETTGYVDVRLIYPKRDRRPVQAFFRVEDVTKIEEFIATHPGANVFFGVTPRIGKTNGTLANCGDLMWLWADLDFKISGEAQARQQLARFPLPPSITVRSGGGLHLYWRLMAPLDFSDKEVCAYAKRLLRAIAIELGADLTAAEPARVLRVPGTFNFKYSPPRVVTVDTLGPEIQYSIAYFENVLAAHLKHEPPHAATSTIANDHQHTEGNHLLNIAEIEDALGFVDADSYDTWLRIGMALHHHFGGAAEGFKLWTAWSQGSDKFDAEAQRKKWESFSLSGNSAGTIRIASLFQLARDNGWTGYKPRRPHNGTQNGNGNQKSPSGKAADEAQENTGTDPDSETGGTSTDGIENEPPLPTKYDEITISNRLVELHGNDMRFIGREWFVYSPHETRWMRDEKRWVFTWARNLCAEVARKAHADILASATAAGDPKGWAKATALATRIASYKTHAAIVSLTREHKTIPAKIDIFDRDHWLLNTRGGVVNLKDGSMRPARREDFFTKRTPVGPAEMPTPIFDQFLRDIMGWHLPDGVCKCSACLTNCKQPDEERLARHRAEAEALCAYLLRFYGYCLTGDVSTHVLMIQIGPGGNGKGLLNGFIGEDILGISPTGYAADIPMEALLMARNERHPTELMCLLGTRLAIGRETGENTRWNEARVKLITGGDLVTARGMRQDFISFPATHKLIVFGNTYPAIRGSDQSAWKRRLHVLLFQQQFADKADSASQVMAEDRNLREKLQAEAPGVLQKLIKGCLEYQRIGLKPPPTVTAASQRYLHDQNRTARWLSERCTRSQPKAKTKAKAAWENYKSWCEEGREFICRQHDFYESLEKLDIKITRSGAAGRYCLGIDLIAYAEDAIAEAELGFEEDDPST